jgi:hypothetical protein
VSVTLGATAPSLYLALLTAVGAGASRARRQAPCTGGAPTTFAVCIPAHDEAANVGETVTALLAQRYGTDHFAVHVVADNCTDATATIAAQHGAEVHVRTDTDQPGKGAALNWLMGRLPLDRLDAIVIVDADTVADPGFLEALDRALASGARAVQGYYGVRDPEVSAAVGLRYAAIACRHHLRPLARNVLGASSGLYGNGMGFRTDLLSGRSWSNHLIEDAEFQMELLLSGHRVVYVPDAKLRAEMPSTLEAARTQSERWELGRAQLVRRYVPRLARKMAAGGPLPRRAYVDAIADQVTPPLSLQALLDVTAVGLSATALLLRPNRRCGLALAASTMTCIVLATHVLVGLRLVGAPRSVYRSLRSAPRAVLWKLLLLARITHRPTAVEWTRTARNAHTSDGA